MAIAPAQVIYGSGIVQTFGESMSFIERRLRELGIKLASGSRFDQMLRVPSPSETRSTPRAIALARQATKDLLELDFILRKLFSERPSDELINSLNRAMNDAWYAIRGPKSADGRNAQAELFAGAVLQHAGLRPEKDDPPDWRFNFGGVPWSLEVKRLQSERKLETRIREGFDALGTSGGTGLLFLDISQALRNEPSQMGSHMPGELVGYLWGRRLKEYVDRTCPPQKLRVIRSGREIRGLIIHDSFLVPKPNLGWVLHHQMFGVCIDQSNQRRMREFDDVFAVIETGTATAANLSD